MTNAEYVAALKTFLSKNIGVSQIRHPDGRSQTFDRVQAMKELEYWQRKIDTASTPAIGRSRFSLKGDA